MKKFARRDEIARDKCHKSTKSHSQGVISCQELHKPLQQTLKNEADEVWRKDPIALPAQEEGHRWADGEGEAAIKENEGIWKVHASKIIRKRKAFL